MKVTGIITDRVFNGWTRHGVANWIMAISETGTNRAYVFTTTARRQSESETASRAYLSARVVQVEFDVSPEKKRVLKKATYL